MAAIKKSISMQDALWEQLCQRAAALGYSTPSAYLQQLVREDVLRQQAHVRTMAPSMLLDRPSSLSPAPAQAAAADAALAGISYAPPKPASPKGARSRRPKPQRSNHPASDPNP